MGVFEHVAEKGLEHHPAFFDIYPAVPLEEDKKYFQEQIGAVCQQYNRPYPNLPDGYLKMFRLKQAGIGIGYGAGMALMPDEKDASFFEDIANTILEAYISVVIRRKDSRYTPQQVEAADKFRSEWSRFIFMENRFFQGGIQLGVPPESFMLHMLPPSVKF
jgi:coproporphyrinogen III oxidase